MWDKPLPGVLTTLARRTAQIATRGSFDKTLLKAVDAHDYVALANWPLPDPEDPRYFWTRQTVSFFSKNGCLCDQEALESLALKQWLHDESCCRETNRIFMLRRYGSFRFEPYVDRVLHSASRKIQRILGPVPSLSELKFAFGPGASVSCKKFTSPRYKLGAELTCSYELFPFLDLFRLETPGWRADDVVSPAFGQLSFVPKSVKALRSIVVEPHLNVFYQKGVGSYLKGRLKRAGCDLTSQEKNRSLAKIGSITDSLATIDLSSASDTISKAVVDELLPPDWVALLSSLRTGAVRIPLKDTPVVEIQKFSSMGNAFTFELESLIFYAIALAVVDQKLHDCVSVFGDDIIVPAPYYRELTKVLHAIGFRVNLQKSYASGPFRESCGKDYVLGRSVRPYFQKTEVTPRTLVTLSNFFWERFVALGNEEDRKFSLWVASLVPEPCVLYGPRGFGDGHLACEPAGFQPLKLRKRGFHGYTFQTWVARIRRVNAKRDLPGDAFLPFYSIYQSSGEESNVDHFAVRDDNPRYRKVWVYTY